MDSEAKIKFLTYAPCATAGMSIIGSCLTLLTIHRTRYLGTKLTTYHRLLVGMSIFDLFLSTGMVLGPLPMPSELAQQGFPSARGTTGSCTWQGFFLTLGMGSFALSSMLAVYFVLVIRFNLSNETLATRVEPFLIGIPTLFHSSIAVAGIALQVYNPNAPWCWAGTYPRGCQVLPDVACERGEEHHLFFARYFLMVPLLTWTGLAILCLLIVAVTVVRKNCHSRRFVFSGSQVSGVQTRQARQVVVQCVLYGTTFLNTTTWTCLNMVLDLANVHLDYMGQYFWILALALLFLPIQGFFNFLIFIRPQYLSNRSSETYRDQGRWIAFREAVWNPKPPAHIRSSSSTLNRISRRRVSRGNNNNNRNPGQSKESGSLGGFHSNESGSHAGCQCNESGSHAGLQIEQAPNPDEEDVPDKQAPPDWNL